MAVYVFNNYGTPKWLPGTTVVVAQNFDGGNIDKFDKFLAICQCFPYQNFSFSYVATQNKIISVRCL